MEKPRLLIVDDEATVLRSLTWLLKKDYEITAANGGQEAIDLIRTQPPFDSIICDCRMPDVTGIEVLSEARERSPQTTRILLTGYAELNSVVGSVNESEIFRFVGKPWNNSDLRSIISDAVSRSRSLTIDSSIAALSPDNDEKFGIMIVDENTDTFEQLKATLGENYPIHRAQDIDSALAIMSRDRIGVLITETGGENETSLIISKEIKEQYPEVVMVVLSEAKDAYLVIDLINELQVFRYLLKPLKTNLLKSSIDAAGKKLSSVDLTSGRGQKAPKQQPAHNPEQPIVKRGVLSRLFQKLIG